jgi:uroporphyrinogen-III synthase
VTDKSSLDGARIALLEARMSKELASLIERSGGAPYCVPAVEETQRDCREDVASAVTWLGQEPTLAVLLNGAGVSVFFRVAGELGREAELRGALARCELLCRGPKPIAALKTRGISASIRVADPYTTHEVLAALGQIPLRDRRALVVHYGERNEAVVAALRAGEVKDLLELSVYEWELPHNLGPLVRLVDEIIARRVDAVAFTSQIQARHLVAVAERQNKRAELLSALSTHTPAAAIGPTCAEVMRELGIPARVVASPPKMGPFVQSLALFLTGGRA